MGFRFVIDMSIILLVWRDFFPPLWFWIKDTTIFGKSGYSTIENVMTEHSQKGEQRLITRKNSKTIIFVINLHFQTSDLNVGAS